MRLLLLNDNYFGNAFKRSGIETITMGPGDGMDIVCDPETESLSQIIERINFKPDVVLQVDSIDTRIFFRGIEELNIPTAFYAIDTPINEFWQHPYSHGFDRIYLDQHETWRQWSESGIDWARWLPLAADSTIFYPPENNSERNFPIVFIGTLDNRLRPKRSAILHRLKKIAPVKIIDGGGTRSENTLKVASLYRKAKIVVNENLFDGVNLRTFEAMATGAVVLNERGRGTEILFSDNEHLTFFDASDLENVVSDLLKNPEKIEMIGQSGARRIREKHTITHRTGTVIRDLMTLKIRKDRNSHDSRQNVFWAMWQASWKWDKNLKSVRKYAESKLRNYQNNLDKFDNAVLLEGMGLLDHAGTLLCDLIESDSSDAKSHAALAALCISRNDIETARKLLNGNNTDLSDLHVAIAERMEKEGALITPGFNRQTFPSIGWNSFEHFQRALILNQDNINALKGLDRILEYKNAQEFIVPLWQQYHARNPEDTYSMKMLRQRAKEGYYMPAKKNEFSLNQIRNHPSHFKSLNNRIKYASIGAA
ncbi:MAG: glycosyltransferase [Candidatus Electryonea clarkiae]|nr:glycosyltransferase [Candidatus Electryonea clarkiae]MDP8285651.1 glycosyltransferase [Candidatus Electryonea clarkiae]